VYQRGGERLRVVFTGFSDLCYFIFKQLLVFKNFGSRVLGQEWFNQGCAKMKCRVLTVLFFAGLFLLANGELTKQQKTWLKDLEISGVRVATIRDEDRNKIELLEITTAQSPNEDNIESGFRIHIVVEISDSKKNKYIADFTGNRPEDLDVEYTGEDYWNFYLPHGELDHPKVEAYAIQYGYMDGETFVVFAENYKRCKTMEELTRRTTTPFPGTIRLKHYYMYDDVDSGVTESVSMTVKQIKTKSVSGSADKGAVTKKNEMGQE
jgi:hypothetical protein